MLRLIAGVLILLFLFSWLLKGTGAVALGAFSSLIDLAWVLFVIAMILFVIDWMQGRRNGPGI